MKKLKALAARLAAWFAGKFDTADAIFTAGLGILVVGIYLKFGVAWACIATGALLMGTSYIGRAVTLLGVLFSSIRGHKK